MKNHRTKLKFFISIASMLFVLTVYNQCLIDNKTNPSRKKQTTTEESNRAPTNSPYDNDTIVNEDDPYPEPSDDVMAPPPMTPPVDVVEIRREQPVVGIKNFEQVFYTMASLTGVPPTNTNVVRVYDEVSTQLPTENDIKTFAPSNHVGVLKLAAEFCDLMIENGTYRSAAYPGFNFNQTPTQVLNTAGREMVVQQSIDHFFGLGVLSPEEQGMIRGEFQGLITTLLANTNLNQSATTRMVVKGLCVASLGSVHLNLF